ncbi:MAG: Spi family protease inhibitor, partial [Thermoanaerobaculia bacterium]|nr:Spi family protease inhibitor [Thermoanaerobaculia bacterium]
MKRFTITALSILFLAQAAFAAPVDRNTAQNAAASFFNTSTVGLYGQQALDFTLAYESKTSLSAVTGSEIPLFYVFNATNTEGFVIISADDA